MKYIISLLLFGLSALLFYAGIKLEGDDGYAIAMMFSTIAALIFLLALAIFIASVLVDIIYRGRSKSDKNGFTMIGTLALLVLFYVYLKYFSDSGLF